MFMLGRKTGWFEEEEGEEEEGGEKKPFNFLVQSRAVWPWQMSVALRR